MFGTLLFHFDLGISMSRGKRGSLWIGDWDRYIGIGKHWILW